jgi:DNA-binding NarL/FixJ family response regulator
VQVHELPSRVSDADCEPGNDHGARDRCKGQRPGNSRPAECRHQRREREVGLLLKGLSHKEIADARSISETTIRQQALAIYRKSGLRSRAELSAFFLEDLLLPVDQR